MINKYDIELVTSSEEKNRIVFKFNKQEYSIYVTNYNELVLSSMTKAILIKPQANNCIVIKQGE